MRVHPPAPRAAVETRRDICMNSLFLSFLLSFFLVFFFLVVSFLSPDLLHVLTWPWKRGGGSQTVLLPKGKEAGRRSYFSSPVMEVKVSQWENGR